MFQNPFEYRSFFLATRAFLGSRYATYCLVHVEFTSQDDVNPYTQKEDSIGHYLLKNMKNSIEMKRIHLAMVRPLILLLPSPLSTIAVTNHPLSRRLVQYDIHRYLNVRNLLYYRNLPSFPSFPIQYEIHLPQFYLTLVFNSHCFYFYS